MKIICHSLSRELKKFCESTNDQSIPISKPKRKGNWWYLLFWQDELVQGIRVRRRKRAKLAPASTPVREVNKIAAELLRPLNQGLLTAGSATNFENYGQNVYRPTVLPLMSRCTSSVLKV
jgi:hypothetical protein